MTRYRAALPQMEGQTFLTDGGLETWLIFHYGFELREFASFEALNSEAGREALKAYYRPFLELAKLHQRGFVLESPTWRASPDWGRKLGYSREQMKAINRQAIEFLEALRSEVFDNPPVVLSGNIGPRGDGYDPGERMTYDEARRYHDEQIGTFRDTNCDMVTALTMTNVEEAVGLAQAAADHALPSAIGFTVETDGKLPSGQTLVDAIEEVDRETDRAPAYFVINCAHPDHFAHVLSDDSPVLQRIRGIRANASRMSHAELDNADELDEGNPDELGAQYGRLSSILPALTVVGGCCGTDIRHVEQICKHTVS